MTAVTATGRSEYAEYAAVVPFHACRLRLCPQSTPPVEDGSTRDNRR